MSAVAGKSSVNSDLARTGDRGTRSTDGRRRGLLSVVEAAGYLGVSPGTLRNWASTRRVEFVKVGRLTRFSEAALDRYIAAHTVRAIGDDE